MRKKVRRILLTSSLLRYSHDFSHIIYLHHDDVEQDMRIHIHTYIYIIHITSRIYPTLVEETCLTLGVKKVRHILVGVVEVGVVAQIGTL